MATDALAPAVALFFRLAGEPGDAGAVRALLSQPVDWALLRALARREGVTAELGRRLRAAGANVPPEVDDAIRREGMAVELHLGRLERSLGEILDVLAAHGLQPVLLKGAGLAYTAYSGFAARPMRDVDLLLPSDEVAVARRLLGAAGWRAAVGTDAGRDYSDHQHAPPLVAPDDAGIVELHHDLFPVGHPFGLTGVAMRAGARVVDTPAGRALVPAPEDQLLHACLHFGWSHELRWGAWRTMADVAALVRRPAGGAMGAAVRWAPFVARAEATRGAAPAYWTLRLAAALAGVPVPADVLAALAPAVPAWIRNALARHYAHQLVPGSGNVPSVAAARALWSAGMRPTAAGHGGVRPWNRTAPVAFSGAPSAEAAAQRRSVGARLRYHAGQLPRWAAYWRAMRG